MQLDKKDDQQIYKNKAIIKRKIIYMNNQDNFMYNGKIFKKYKRLNRYKKKLIKKELYINL